MRNPAFDVTPHRYITAIITDRGVFHPPFTKTLGGGGREPTFVNDVTDGRNEPP